MKFIYGIMIVCLPFFVVSCVSVKTKEVDRSSTVEITSHKSSDKFTGIKSCFVTRKERHWSKLISEALRSDAFCGDKIHLIQSDSLSLEKSSYLGIKYERFGGCSRLFDIPSEIPTTFGYWNFNEKKGKTLFPEVLYARNKEGINVRPKPTTLIHYSVIEAFLRSNSEGIHVRMGEVDSLEVIIGRELIVEFEKKCINQLSL